MEFQKIKNKNKEKEQNKTIKLCGWMHFFGANRTSDKYAKLIHKVCGRT